jgi:hypothetical protein
MNRIPDIVNIPESGSEAGDSLDSYDDPDTILHDPPAPCPDNDNDVSSVRAVDMYPEADEMELSQDAPCPGVIFPNRLLYDDPNWGPGRMHLEFLYPCTEVLLCDSE